MINLFCQNLCSWGSGENTIAERTTRFTKLIEMYAPDIIGVQETTPQWREYLYANMPGFEHIGLPRQEGPKGESSDIFWRTDKYALLSGGTRWLTDTPNVISKLDASSHYRVFSWAVLRQKESGKEFLVCNVHTDYITQEVCREQLELMVQFAEEFHMPTVYLGDMNMTRDHSGYAYMCSKYMDVYEGTGQTDPLQARTSHGFGIKAEDCDYVFINEGLKAEEYRAAMEKIDGKFVSDHYGIYARLSFE